MDTDRGTDGATYKEIDLETDKQMRHMKRDI